VLIYPVNWIQNLVPRRFGWDGFHCTCISQLSKMLAFMITGWTRERITKCWVICWPPRYNWNIVDHWFKQENREKRGGFSLWILQLNKCYVSTVKEKNKHRFLLHAFFYHAESVCFKSVIQSGRSLFLSKIKIHR
jgi:hypothetical protein